jgi:hypothetical protein
MDKNMQDKLLADQKCGWNVLEAYIARFNSFSRQECSFHIDNIKHAPESFHVHLTLFSHLLPYN